MTLAPTLAVYLRRADALDAGALAALRVASLTEMGLIPPGDGPTFAAQARREFWSLLREERAEAWILCVDGRVCGCACVVYWQRLPYPEGALHAEIAGVYVAPAERGKGYASELLAETLAAARARGVRRILLQPTRRSTGLYARFGFRPSGQLALNARATPAPERPARSRPSAPNRLAASRPHA